MKGIVIVIVSVIVASCNRSQVETATKQPNLDSLKGVLKQTDLAFSQLSKEKGRNAAFLEYMDQNVTMLRPGGMPLVGKDTMQKRFSERPDTSYTLTWEPLYADISSSGDLGYTYGKWLLVTTAHDSSEGTYCSIWKKDTAGNWRFVLDTGNEGLKPGK